jgi:hypothetical protein
LQFTEEFFRDELNHARPVANTFEFSGLNRELELIQPKPAEWAADFMQHQKSSAVPQFEEFEQIYQKNQAHPQQFQGKGNEKHLQQDCNKSIKKVEIGQRNSATFKQTIREEC